MVVFPHPDTPMMMINRFTSWGVELPVYRTAGAAKPHRNVKFGLQKQFSTLNSDTVGKLVLRAYGWANSVFLLPIKHEGLLTVRVAEFFGNELGDLFQTGFGFW